MQSGVVNGLIESLAEPHGLLQPIIVQSWGGAGFKLIVGKHRFEAAKAQGWATIDARVLNGVDADAAELIEIDENLIRAELSPAERALHIGKRKELYEKLHPETKHGGAPGKAGGGKKAKDAKLAPFAEATAKATGQSKRKVARDATRATKCVVLSEIAGTCLDNGTELDALAQLPEAEQRALAERAKAGELVSAKPSAKATKPDTQPTVAEIAEAQLRNVERNANFMPVADVSLLRQQLHDALLRAEAAESERDRFMQQLKAVTSGTAEAWYARSKAEQKLIVAGWGPEIVRTMGAETAETIFQNASTKTRAELQRCAIGSLADKTLDPKMKAAVRLVKRLIEPTHRIQLKAEAPSVATSTAGPTTGLNDDSGDFPEMPPFLRRVH